MESTLKRWKNSTLLFLMSAVLFLQHSPSFFMPLWKRDEGYWWVLAAELSRGGVLYRDAADNRAPLFVYFLSGLISLFGDHAFLILHLLVALGNIFVLLLLYRIGKNFFDEKIALYIALFYLILQGSFTSQEVLAAHTENVAMPFLILGFYLYCVFLKRGHFMLLFLSGLLIGAAFQIRQTMGIQLAVQGLHLILRAFQENGSSKKWKTLSKELLILASGFSVLPLSFAAYFYRLGVFDDFLFWCYFFNQKYYVTGVSTVGFFRILWEGFWRTGVIVFAGGGVWFLFFHSLRYWRTAWREGSLWILFFLGSFLTVPVGWRFSHHYYVPLFPCLALLAGWVLYRREKQNLPLLPIPSRWFFIALAVPFFAFFIESVCHVVLKIPAYGRDDSAVIGQKLKEIASPQDPLYIWGYTPAVYFFSGLPNASRFVVSQYHTWQVRVFESKQEPPPIVSKMWEWLFEDFAEHPPKWILDTTAYPLSGRYLDSMENYPRIKRFVEENYEDMGKINEAKLYRRKSQDSNSK